jgi:hypothetical protein
VLPIEFTLTPTRYAEIGGHVSRVVPIERALQEARVKAKPGARKTHGRCRLERALAARLPGSRLHLQHGPIDLVIEAWGEPEEVEASLRASWTAVPGHPAALVSELPVLRAVRCASPTRFARGPVARRMVASLLAASQRFHHAHGRRRRSGRRRDARRAARRRTLARAYVNDGGDIALHIADGEHLACRNRQ